MSIIHPTLNLVARPGVSPPQATFTRATTATRVNALGKIATAAAGVLRHDHHPMTGEYLGWLIEEQRTNLLTYSDDFSHANWVKPGATVAANAGIAPDGTVAADGIVEGVGATSGRSYQALTKAASAIQYTYSVFLKAVSRGYAFIAIDDASTNYAHVGVNLLTGAIRVPAAGSGFTSVTATVKDFGNGWYRVSLTATTNTATNLRAYVSVDDGTKVNYSSTYTGNGSAIYTWGAQLEAGSFATSYIPTASAAATRNADLLTVATSGFDFNPAEGTLLVNFDLIGGPATEQVAVTIDDGSGDNRVVIYRDSGANASVLVASGAASALGASISTLSNNTSARVALSYKVNDFAWCRDGGTVATDTAGAVPVSPTAVRIGATHAGQMLNGHLRHVAYFPRRLADADLQTVTE